MISNRSNLINLITDFILDFHSFASTTQQQSNSENFYWYDSTTGIYQPDAEGKIFDTITRHFPAVRSRSAIWAIIDKVQQLSLTDNLDDPQYTCYLNGVYDHKQNKLLLHLHSFYLTKQIPQNYIAPTPSSSLTLNSQRLELLNAID